MSKKMVFKKKDVMKEIVTFWDKDERTFKVHLEKVLLLLNRVYHFGLTDEKEKKYLCEHIGFCSNGYLTLDDVKAKKKSRQLNLSEEGVLLLALLVYSYSYGSLKDLLSEKSVRDDWTHWIENEIFKILKDFEEDWKKVTMIKDDDVWEKITDNIDLICMKINIMEMSSKIKYSLQIRDRLNEVSRIYKALPLKYREVIYRIMDKNITLMEEEIDYTIKHLLKMEDGEKGERAEKIMFAIKSDGNYKK